MWKEKYEAAIADAAKFVKEQHLPLVDAHDALAKRVLHLEERIRASVAAGETVLEVPPAKTAAKTVFELPGLDRQYDPVLVAPNGVDVDAIYRYILDRAAKQPDRVLISLLVDRPELEVKVAKRMINSSDDSTQGRVAVLIYEKFFDSAKDAGDVTREFKRRGWFDAKASNAALIKPLAQITEWGFLTKEDTGYQAVPGMKVNVVEARS